jgi:two-component system, OmpR family, manganese sensing sensor histidine kinase
MFQKTRSQLTLAYLGVLSLILTLFTVAVRWSFTRSLNQQFDARLENLAKAAAFNLDNEEGELEADDDEILVDSQQVIEWFDLEGDVVGKQGEYELDIPFNLEYLSQIHDYPHSIRSFTKSVYNLDTKELIGYVRGSESLTELEKTLRRLDYGLGSGIAIALLASGFGSIWLTNRAMQPIESSFGKLQQFTADASHELRSPLMAIKINADVALKYSAGMRSIDAEKFKAIASAANQMTSLTENLLLLARTDQAIQLQPELIDLNDLLTDLMQLYKPQAEAKQLLWQIQLEPDLSLSGDLILLKQLFTNLLHNALYYTPKDGSVIVKAEKIHSYINIQIEDNGIGIAPEHINKIFERFWRVDKSRSYQSGKSGLGLAIVKEIVRLHNGSISVKSELGKGSCFYLRFLINI